MVNKLGKFTPKIAELSQPLRELLSSKRTWVWGPTQATAFQEIKNELARPTTLALYSLDAPTKIVADASAYATTIRSVEACHLCLSINDRHREEVLTD